MLKRILKILACVVAAILVLVIGLVAWLSITEFKPADREPVTRYTIKEAEPVQEGQDLTVYAWNIGYAGLGKDSDFFMDGGKMVDPPSQEAVEENMAAISAYISAQAAAGGRCKRFPDREYGSVCHFAGKLGGFLRLCL